MVRYETLFLTVPEITSDETSLLESGFRQILHDHKALDLSFERWGKYLLAYPVRKNEYGVYFLARFEVDPAAQQDTLKSLDMLMKVKLNSIVMRYSTYRLEENTPLTYQRPESLEEAPVHDVDTVLKEGAGLLGHGRPRGRYHQNGAQQGHQRPYARSRRDHYTGEMSTSEGRTQEIGEQSDDIATVTMDKMAEKE